MLGIVCASMSTADGAILAMGTVFAHNIVRQLDGIRPDLVTPKNLLRVTRIATVPVTLASGLIATYNAGQTGYLLIVAFDIMLSSVVVPLFGCFYCKFPRPNAALLAVLCGATARIIMEFTLPKDGSLLMPYKVPEFQKAGPAASALVPTFVDAPPGEAWDPEVQVCETTQYKDFTGVDSLASLLIAFLVFVTVQTLEFHLGRPLFTIPFLEPYEKDLGDKDDEEEKVADTKHIDGGDESADVAPSEEDDVGAKIEEQASP